MEDIKQLKERITSIRLRTLIFTITILITLVIYFFIQATFKEAINFVDLAFLIIVQILTYCLYFPDGEIFGAKDKIFIENRKQYNEKAHKIVDKFDKLREYCKYEYETKKQNYILKECSFIGITLDQLEIFKEYNENQIKKLEVFEYKIGEKTQLLIFNREKRKRLYALLFKPIPVEENKPETIMSGLENNGYSAIHDTSVTYTKKSYATKIILSLVISLLLAYIGVTSRDGVTIAEIFKIFMYVFTIVTTAITGFIAGEKTTRVHKNNFYLRLGTFIDEFNCWALTQKKEEPLN